MPDHVNLPQGCVHGVPCDRGCAQCQPARPAGPITVDARVTRR